MAVISGFKLRSCTADILSRVGARFNGGFVNHGAFTTSTVEWAVILYSTVAWKGFGWCNLRVVEDPFIMARYNGCHIWNTTVTDLDAVSITNFA